MNFEAYIESLGLRYFRPSEFLIGLDRGNTPPPAELWPNIALTAILVDEARHTFKRPATITSAYRAPAYNRAVGGGKLSQHQAGSAIDFKVKGVPAPKVYELLKSWRGRRFDVPVKAVRFRFVAPAGPVPFAELPTWDRRNGAGSIVQFAGGLGRYETFTHVDTRGINSTWRG